MILNQTAIYALRAMTNLVLDSDQAPLSAKELSKLSGVPVHYLSKIMRRMVTAGLVVSQKGHGGGFVLANTPEKILFADILEAVEIQVEPDKCVFAWGACDPDDPCPLHSFWSQLNEMHISWAEGTTLADVKQAGNLPH